MPRMSQKRKLEWFFFLNDRNRITYNSQCRQCRCPCTCQCRREQLEKEEQARKEQQRLDRIRRLKANGLQDRALFAYTFDVDSGTNPAMQYARRYVERWTAVKAQGQGLLLWGSVGTGKTFAAACIANALTEQGIPILMTNFSKILNSLSGMFSEDKNRLPL